MGRAEILIVDDERAIREGLRGILLGEGFEVRTAHDGGDALRKIAERRPDLVLLDVMMPKVNGFRCCEEIRKGDALLPVVFLTAKDSDADQVRGIGLGADDYVSKEADGSVLLARINRALARADDVRSALKGRLGQPIRLGSVAVDVRALSVSDKGVEIASMTRTEADILALLDSERGRYFTLDEIVAGLRGEGFVCSDSVVYSHISNLRKKLGRAGDMISSGRGAGYALVE